MNLQEFYQQNPVTDFTTDMIEMVMSVVLFSTYFSDFSVQQNPSILYSIAGKSDC